MHQADLSRTPLHAILVALLFISGCATPQEKAIKAFCENQATQAYPEKFEQRQVERYVKVGERTKGFKNTCKTAVRVDKVTKTKTEETTCIDEPIVEPIYEARRFIELVDINQPARSNEVVVCTTRGLAQGMFKEVK
jgi:hypothetical protein